jgi:hypothetical protein
MLRDNLSVSAKLSQNIGSSSFWNLIVGYQQFSQEQGDGVFFDDLEAYGDTLKNSYLRRQADDAYNAQDDVGIFSRTGRVNNNYRRYDNNKFTGNFNFTSQIGNHLFEAGIGGFYGTLRYYNIYPMSLAKNIREYTAPNGDIIPAKSKEARYDRANPYRYGYDLYGNINETDDPNSKPKNPILAYAYVQDRFELEDLVLNLGLRVDYFDPQTDIIKDPANPYNGGTDPTGFDKGDFITKDSELHFSPRIGLGFPVTESTVFHAQYGKFIQEPRLIDLYSFMTGRYSLAGVGNESDYTLNNGYIESEITTQYEVGFRQILGDNMAAINITAFYKNTEGLTNTGVQYFYREVGGQRLRYFTPTNQDFGTVKGLAFSIDVSRLSYFSLSLDYTFSIAEGTGSSTNSSFVAAFRNNGDEVPKVIAPLDFDQRHTGIVIVDFFIPRGDLGWLEMLDLNFLVSFASGRPFTPLETQNLLEGSTNWGDTKGYVNSRFGPGTFKVDMKLQKSFPIGSSTTITPYLWIENLFGAENATSVWRSTGSPYTTDYLSTEEGQKLSKQNGEDWVNDYMSLERNPSNFGIPRLIKLGIKVNFAAL